MKDYIAKFEEGDPPERIIEETRRQKKRKETEKRVEEHKTQNKVIAETCKNCGNMCKLNQSTLPKIQN